MVFVDRETKYENEGRMQTEDEAKSIDERIKHLLNMNDIKYVMIPTTQVVDKVINVIKEKL